ncbi:MAG: hypothetical protein KAJ32_02590 [Gammaproteobacteria bacterium]|nr:hypothetical protein [Gammaproteobacteria bacterium]
MTNKNKYLWVTWEVQRRNRSLSTELSATLVEIISDKHRLFRYLTSVYKTLSSIKHHKPEILFVQNPSIVLAFTTVIYHKLTKLPVVIDAHNSGIYPSAKDRSILNSLARFIIKNTPLTIVTNDNLANYVASAGGRAAVLPDPLPEIMDNYTRKKLKGDFNVLFICSWADDEPYQNVIEAAHLLSDNICIYITGKHKSNEASIQRLPDNVILTGYLSEADFNSMLFSCDLILDLTTRDDCLVCGAYESLATNRPMILSETIALKNYFKDSAIYTDNTTQDIAKKIKFSLSRLSQLEARTIDVKEEITCNWQHMFTQFRKGLERL